MSVLTNSIQYYTVLARENMQDKEIKPWERRKVISIHTWNDYIENLPLQKNLFELINMFSNFAEYNKINIKCVAFLYNPNEQPENLENSFIYSSM